MVNKTLYIRKFDKSKYSVLFDSKSGLFIRKEYKGYDEPFCNVESPELLDISITNYCEKACEFCYRESSVKGQHMCLNDYKKIIVQASELGVFQVALGGGNPNQHPDFIEILKMTRENGIVPSYTTNGHGINDDIIKATKMYCGAVAVSLYEPYNESFYSIQKFLNDGVKVNIHYLLSEETINSAINILNNPQKLQGINALVFLNYKPISSQTHSLLKSSNQITKFIQTINNNNFNFKIGFDSCSISFLLQEGLLTDDKCLDFCEAGRFSAFISEKAEMYPCSFMVSKYKGASLKNNRIGEVWKHDENFVKIRKTIKDNRCKNKCRYVNQCNGGCSLFTDINHKSCF